MKPGYNLIKKLLLLALASGCFSVAYPQANQIKKRSDTNTQNRNYTAPNPTPNKTTPAQSAPSQSKPASSQPERNTNNNHNSQNYYSTPRNNYNYNNRNSANTNQTAHTDMNDACVTGCTEGCTGCVNFFDLLIQRFIRHQQFLVATKFDNPRILSIEFIPLVAYTFQKSMIYLPRARVTWGMFSSDFRVNYLKEFKGPEFETDDWQVIMLNLFSKKDFYLRIGTGFLYEKYSTIYFNEHTVSTDFKLEEKFTSAFEFRLAHDNTTKILPRIESSLRLNYQVIKTDKISLDISLGIMYQNYYQTVKIYSLQTGLVLMLF